MDEREYAQLYAAIPPFEENFRIGFNSFEQLTTMRPHWHEHIEFVYVTEGEGVFVIDGERFSVTRGDLIVANPNTLHVLLSAMGIDYHCLLVFPDFLEEDRINTLTFESHIRADALIGAIFSDLRSEYDGNAKAANIMKKSLVYKLIAYLARNYAGADLSQAELQRRTVAFSRIRRVEDFVAANYRSSISTKDLAAAFYVTENHFCRLFKKTFGMSFMEYVHEYRIGKAELLLSGTGLSITEIAAAVGFDSANYFSRVFRRLRRETPLEFRSRALRRP